VYATTTGECRCDLANRREQPNGDQSEFHDQPLGIRSICPTADDFYAAFRQASYARTHATKLFRTLLMLGASSLAGAAISFEKSAVWTARASADPPKLPSSL
jgi:hypothetical protein